MGHNGLPVTISCTAQHSARHEMSAVHVDRRSGGRPPCRVNKESPHRKAVQATDPPQYTHQHTIPPAHYARYTLHNKRRLSACFMGLQTDTPPPPPCHY